MLILLAKVQNTDGNAESLKEPLEWFGNWRIVTALSVQEGDWGRCGVFPTELLVFISGALNKGGMVENSQL